MSGEDAASRIWRMIGVACVLLAGLAVFAMFPEMASEPKPVHYHEPIWLVVGLWAVWPVGAFGVVCLVVAARRQSAHGEPQP